ncbi:MAG: YgeY family selenium metabolism-linked hydrolase [Tractidigestivibacter sp.]|jgi:putative selenium metabolism hydrolase|uniref:YgeY family selenium metabolism-linked hydrolase n=1 Tax=Tractidigestivibacter sp. TaxID=2847320 RepID=UPI003D8E12FF
MEPSRSQQLVELCQSLVRAKSYSGEEKDVADCLYKEMESMKFDEVRIDKNGSVIGTIHGNRPGPTVLFDGHIDTVPAENAEKWTYPPFEAQIHDGKIWGRGTSDMKGADAAFTKAVGWFAADTNRDFAGTICVAGVVQEECFEGVASRTVSSICHPDYVIIGEASNCNIKVGQRGRAELTLVTHGKPAHSANPEKGVNAVYKMCDLVEQVRQIEPPEHPVLGKGILELVDIKSEPYPGASVVPEGCRATYDRRLLVDETPEGVLDPVKSLIDQLSRNDPQLSAEVDFTHAKATCYTGEVIEAERFFPGWLYDEHEEWIERIKGHLEEKGLNPAVAQYNFCTNGSHYAGEAHIPTIGLGPSREDLAHTVDEYIEISQLERACESYYGILEALLG